MSNEVLLPLSASCIVKVISDSDILSVILSDFGIKSLAIEYIVTLMLAYRS